MYTCLRTKVNESGAVATIEIAREEKRNALSPAAIMEMTDALKSYDADPRVQVIVLTGAGTRVFSAGADFGEAVGGAGSADSFGRCEGMAGFAALLKQIRKLKKPIIARVNGHALGGGFGLASICDIVIAADDCKFGTPETGVGMFPWVIMPVLLQATPYTKKLLELVLTGGKVNAGTAMQLGFVNHVVPRDRLDAKVDEIASQLVDKSPRLARIGRSYFFSVLGMDFEQAMDYGVSMLAANVGSEEAAEGITAFLEKRKPVWKAR